MAEDVEKQYGLKTYCQKYGQMSPTVHLDEDHAEFSDWHMCVPLGDKYVKVLCCPEDVKCGCDDIAKHGPTVCCDQCEAPICKECAEHIDARKAALPPAALSNDVMKFDGPVEL